MAITDTIREIKARAEQVLAGPEVEHMGRFYSAATLDVQALLAIAEQMILEGSDAEAQEQIASLQAAIETLTGDLAAKSAELAELQTQYDRVMSYLDGIPGHAGAAGSGAIPNGGRE